MAAAVALYVPTRPWGLVVSPCVEGYEVKV
jgi:hypothetical protein